VFFVDYLRLCFRFGGFPGYEGIDRGIPAEIATLSEGLLSSNARIGTWASVVPRLGPLSSCPMTQID
jgi:hypothetical protein